MMKVAAGLALVSTFAVQCRADWGASDETLAARVDALVQGYSRCGYLNGAVLVARHGKVVYGKGVGLANFELAQPNTTQTRFGVASITKQFTAVLVLQQVAKGTVQLQRTVADYLPWYRKDTGSRMTIEQLIHHTSGLPADYDWPEFSDTYEASRRYEPGEFARKFCQPDLVSRPGTQWAYSNSGYILLGLILEQATGTSFKQLLKDQILDPVGLRDTGLVSHDYGEIDAATGYTRHAGPRYTPGRDLDLGHVWSAGAMYSTAEDLLRWNEALSSGKLLPAPLQAELFKPGLGNWACGWFVTKIGQGAPGAGSTVQEMRGDMPGNFFTWVLRYPDQDTVVIVLRNAYGSTEHFEEKLQSVLFGQEPQLPRRNPKDVVARAWMSSCATLEAHQNAAFLAPIAILAIGYPVFRRKGKAQHSN